MEPEEGHPATDPSTEASIRVAPCVFDQSVQSLCMLYPVGVVCAGGVTADPCGCRSQLVATLGITWVPSDCKRIIVVRPA